jgi:hypothetical protein
MLSVSGSCSLLGSVINFRYVNELVQNVLSIPFSLVITVL